MPTHLAPTQFNISTPATYNSDNDMSSSQDEDEEEDGSDLGNLDRQILQTLQDSGLLDIDAIGEIDPELVDQFSSLDSQKPPLPISFPPLSSIQVPGLSCTVSDDVVIGPLDPNGPTTSFTNFSPEPLPRSEIYGALKISPITLFSPPVDAADYRLAHSTTTLSPMQTFEPRFGFSASNPRTSLPCSPFSWLYWFVDSRGKARWLRRDWRQQKHGIQGQGEGKISQVNVHR